jgi:ribosomal protein L11 methyltransferase
VIELWTSLGDDVASIQPALADALGSLCNWRFVEVDEAVADTWRQHAQATWVHDDLVVVPAWLPDPLPRQRPDEPAVTCVSIEPGSTFGAGDHPTTVLSLRALRRQLREERAAAVGQASVLDVGCGSGVLAVAAVMMGARSATGIDISPAAVPITTANAQANGVASMVTVSNAPLAAIANTGGVFDIVVANILAPALIELAHDLVRVLADDGVLIISGLLVDRYHHVVAALAPLRVTGLDDLNGWVAVTLQRR